MARRTTPFWLWVDAVEVFGGAKMLGIVSVVKSLAVAIGTTMVTAFTAMGLSATAAWAAATLGVSLLIAAIVLLFVKFDAIKEFFLLAKAFKLWNLQLWTIRQGHGVRTQCPEGHHDFQQQNSRQ